MASLHSNTTEASRVIAASPLVEPSVADVVEKGLLRSVYQPVVDLSDGSIVGYEALTRGPIGTRLERPDQLFLRAQEQGLKAELDWACQISAIEGAIQADLGRQACLLINVEPVSLVGRRPDYLEVLLDRSKAELNVIIEITERELTKNPAAVLRELDSLRDRGLGIAIDDLGADPASLALLPFLEPDIIKLDLGLVQGYGTSQIASIADAVRADAERRGTIILAEGIETEAHLATAKVMGATLGQGWFFGYPGELVVPDSEPADLWRHRPVRQSGNDIANTPWDLIAHRTDIATSTKDLLLPMSQHIESQARAQNECPVVLAAFQHARHFTSATLLRFERLAEHASFVGALGVDLASEPARGVRGGSIPEDHDLAGEWTVAVVGPHYAAALIAKDLGDQGPEPDRRFDFLITYQRDVVTAVAKSLLDLITPC